MQYSLLTLALTVASTFAQSTTPAVSDQQAGCQAQYTSCQKTAKTEDQCKCDLTSCLGEMNDRIAAACSSFDAAASLTSASTMASATTTTAEASSSSGFACNPAHQYPAGQYCTEISGSLTLVTSSAAASTSAATTTSACSPTGSAGAMTTMMPSMSAPVYMPTTLANGTIATATSGNFSASASSPAGVSTGAASSTGIFGGLVAVVCGVAAWVL